MMGLVATWAIFVGEILLLVAEPSPIKVGAAIGTGVIAGVVTGLALSGRRR